MCARVFLLAALLGVINDDDDDERPAVTRLGGIRPSDICRLKSWCRTLRLTVSCYWASYLCTNGSSIHVTQLTQQIANSYSCAAYHSPFWNLK